MTRFTFTIPDKMIAVLELEAERLGLSQAAYIRQTLGERLELELKGELPKLYKNRTYENGILVRCSECFELVRHKIETGELFKTPKIPLDIKKDEREDFLYYLIAFLLNSVYGEYDFPRKSRELVTKKLEQHGQFDMKHVEQYFERERKETAPYSTEYYKLYKFSFEKEKTLPDVRYNFPGMSCDFKKLLKFCPVDVEILNCPDCGEEVWNTPENVTWNVSQDLVCPTCIRKPSRDDPTPRGIIRYGNPPHHGRWSYSKPRVLMTQTDYVMVGHTNCKHGKKRNSFPNDSSIGTMEITGLYIDPSVLVLALTCIDCGYRDVLKIRKKTIVNLEDHNFQQIDSTQEQDIPVLSVDGGIWRKLKSRSK